MPRRTGETGGDSLRFRVDLGQGGLAVAIALNYHLLDGAPFRDVVFTAALVSVLLTDVFSARYADAVLWPRLRRARRPEQRPSGADG